jgi:hypothetical protein
MKPSGEGLGDLLRERLIAMNLLGRLARSVFSIDAPPCHELTTQGLGAL